MSSPNIDFLVAMNRQGRRAEEGGTRIIARTPSPASSDTFRSGWSRPPQLIAPRGVSPASSDTSTRSNRSNPAVVRAPLGSAMSRSDSAPCARPGSSCDRVQLCDPSDSRASRTRPRSRTPLATQPLDSQAMPFRGRAQSAASERSDVSNPFDENRSIQSSEASFVMLPGQAGSIGSDVKGPHHEGWLSKLTSHKLAARWQSRYWTLQGCILRYHKQRGGPCLRSFDIRRVQSVQIPQGFTRELEMDFGFRVWRLRADSPQVARRWLLLLEAARLVAGEPLEEGGGCENWSDDDSASSCSTSDSISRTDASLERSLLTMGSEVTGSFDGPLSRSSTPKSSQSAEAACNVASTTRTKGLLSSSIQNLLPKAVTRDSSCLKVPELLSAEAIADRLEVDSDDLDRRFDSWLKHKAGDGDTPHSGTPHFGSTKSNELRDGLAEAFSALWEVFGGITPEAAVTSWKGSQMPEPQAFADAADSVISEYLSRMLKRLQRWIEACDPSSDEIADAGVWFIFDGRSALEQFEALAVSELKSKPTTNCHGLANQIESLLLGEWETRSCDEFCHMVEAAYAKGSASRALLSEVGDEGKDRIGIVLNHVRTTLQSEAWRDHAAACDRATSVLIASLNAVLRSFRAYVNALLSLALPNGGRISGGGKWRLGKVLSRLSKHSFTCIEHPRSIASARTSQTAIAMAASDAAQLAEFCREAKTAKSPVMTVGVSADVIAAFSTAFEREACQLSIILAEVHFTERYRQVLKEINFSVMRQQAVSSGTSLERCCIAAREFLEEISSSSASACSAQASDAVIRTIVQFWIRALRRGPPRLSNSSTQTICNSIAADEAALQDLAAAYGANAKWEMCSASQDPLQPLREIRQTFEDESADKLGISAARLEVMLGAELGSSVASAVRFAMTH